MTRSRKSTVSSTQARLQDTSLSGLGIGERNEDGAIYLGVSRIRSASGGETEFDLFMSPEDIAAHDGRASLREAWVKASRRIHDAQDFHGRPGSAMVTEAELKADPQSYDGGWMLPTRDELRMMRAALDAPGVAATFNSLTSCDWYWSCSEVEDLERETNGLLAGRDNSYYVRTVNLDNGFESRDGKGRTPCASRPVYRVKR